jgi:hypothetical protein
MNQLFNKITWNFIKEGVDGTTDNVRPYIRNLSEVLSSINLTSLSVANKERILIAKEHLHRIKLNVNKLEEKNKFLQEQLVELETKVKVLEEEKSKLLEEKE